MRIKRCFLPILIFVLMILMISTFKPLAFSEELTTEKNIWNRSYLTGNWSGLRPSLIDKGITFDLEYTSTYQGLLSGTGRDDYEYGGIFDGFLKLDSARLGLWNGGGFRTHFEYRHGKASETDGFRAGALWPVNTAQLLPLGAHEEVEATSLYLTQQIGENGSILFGKINVIDLLAADSFFGGWGNRRFMNIAFVAPPSGVLPPIIFGAITSLKTGPLAWTLMVFDPNDRTTDYFPDDLFSDGLNASLSCSYSGVLAGRKTGLSINFGYSTKEGADLSDVLLPPEDESGAKEGSYNISFQFSHLLQESAEFPGVGWGFFMKTAVADGNPNPIDASFVGGIGGKALFVDRPQDSFGLGYYYYAFSDDLQSALDPIIDFHDEQGLEAFYSYAVTPWLHLTGDIQYIDPASGGHDNALVTGLRLNIRF